jgi:hypothetical protein
MPVRQIIGDYAEKINKYSGGKNVLEKIVSNVKNSTFYYSLGKQIIKSVGLISSPPATMETGNVGREIESRRGICTYVHM